MNFVQQSVKKLDNFQQRVKPLAFGYAVIKKYSEEETGYKAALLTYYSFLALFPLLMVLATISSIALKNEPELQKTVIEGATSYFPMLGTQLSDHIHALNKNGLALWAGILFTLYGTRGLAVVFQRGMRSIWGFEADPKMAFPKNLVHSLTIIIVGGLGLITAAILTGFAAAAGTGWEFRIISVTVNLVILYLVFLFLIKYSLPKKVRRNEVRPAALCIAIGLVILQLVGNFVLARELKNLDALYSYFALALGLLFWVYLQAQVIYYSAQLATVKAKDLWPRKILGD